MTMTWQVRLIQRDPGLHIYLIGIGGAGLSGIALILHEMGFRVSGSDRQESANTQRLCSLGVELFTSQEAANIEKLTHKPDVVLMSSAIDLNHPEFQAALAADIPVIKRDRFLPVMLLNKQVIAIAGTHGKSTTTSMVVKILRESGIQAGYLIGTTLSGFGNASSGDDECDIFIVEADEYDHMFLGLKPTVAIITNVEWDHPDCFPTEEAFTDAFAKFAANVAEKGLIISCADDEGAEAIRLSNRGKIAWTTYGESPAADLRIQNLQPVAAGGYQAVLSWWNAPAGRLQLQVPGLYNVKNALAALYAARWAGVPIQQSCESLSTFGGAARRFEIKGEVDGITVIDDYAHHPTEVKATLSAARDRYPQRRIWAVFQPHTYSRTKEFFSDMCTSFDAADQVLVTDIYAAREQDDGRISSAALVAASPHLAIQHVPAVSEAAMHLAHVVEPGDVIITLGAGDSYRIGELLLERLDRRAVVA